MRMACLMWRPVASHLHFDGLGAASPSHVLQEKEDFARERERLRAEIARDKAERQARGGRLASKLGVDGYNPSAPQGAYGAPAQGPEGGAPASTNEVGPKEKKLSSCSIPLFCAHNRV